MRLIPLFFGWLLCHPFLHSEISLCELEQPLQTKASSKTDFWNGCIANKIGDLADSKMGTEQIGDIAQEIFHGFLGAGIGAGTAAIMGQDVGKGATSGAISAVVGHSTAKISGSKELGNLVAVAVAMMTDQDVGIAYMASNNATTYNYEAHQKQNAEAKGDEKEDEEVAEYAQEQAKQSFLAGLQEGEQNKPTAEQQAYERGRQRYVKESLNVARRHRGRELSDRSRERVIDSASKVFGRYHSSCEALGIMTNPANVLKAVSYVPGAAGFISGVGEAAYGLHKGTHDQLDAIQAIVSGTSGILGKGFKNLTQGAGVVKGFKKLGGTGAELSAADARRLLKGPNQVSSAPTVEGLAAKYSGKKVGEAESVLSFKGGSYGKLEALQNLERHHMPADSITSIPYRKGPAIQMSSVDHAKTSSYGSKASAKIYREEIKVMIDQGNIRGAMAKEVLDVRQIARAKYNKAMLEMLDYAKSTGIIPGKK